MRVPPRWINTSFDYSLRLNWFTAVLVRSTSLQCAQLSQPALPPAVVLDVVKTLAFRASKIDLPDVRVPLQGLSRIVHHDAAALNEITVRDNLQRRHCVLLDQQHRQPFLFV